MQEFAIWFGKAFIFAAIMSIAYYIFVFTFGASEPILSMSIIGPLFWDAIKDEWTEDA